MVAGKIAIERRLPPSREKRRSTKAILIDVAEEFFANHGLEGSSLREISAAAGQRNYNAVQYHFGTKRGLVNAILDARYREVDEIRKDLVSAEHGNSDIMQLSVRELLRLIWEPVFILVLRGGGANFPRFELQYRLNLREADHPFYELDKESVPVEMLCQDKAKPIIYNVARALRTKFTHLENAEFHKRTATISYMFLCFLVDRGDANSRGRASPFDVEFNLILEMMTAALSVRV